MTQHTTVATSIRNNKQCEAFPLKETPIELKSQRPSETTSNARRADRVCRWCGKAVATSIRNNKQCERRLGMSSESNQVVATSSRNNKQCELALVNSSLAILKSQRPSETTSNARWVNSMFFCPLVSRRNVHQKQQAMREGITMKTLTILLLLPILGCATGTNEYRFQAVNAEAFRDELAVVTADMENGEQVKLAIGVVWCDRAYRENNIATQYREACKHVRGKTVKQLLAEHDAMDAITRESLTKQLTARSD